MMSWNIALCRTVKMLHGGAKLRRRRWMAARFGSVGGNWRVGDIGTESSDWRLLNFIIKRLTCMVLKRRTLQHHKIAHRACLLWHYKPVALITLRSSKRASHPRLCAVEKREVAMTPCSLKTAEKNGNKKLFPCRSSAHKARNVTMMLCKKLCDDFPSIPPATTSRGIFANHIKSVERWWWFIGASASSPRRHLVKNCRRSATNGSSIPSLKTSK